MQAILQNSFATFLTFVYVQSVIIICATLVQRQSISLLLSRKVVHMAAACQVLFWPLYSTDHWSWIGSATVPTLFAIQMIVKGIIVSDPNDPDVRTMSRTGQPLELCQGPLFFALALIYCTIFSFRQDTATFLMAAMGFGDGLAPLVGAYFPFGRYRTMGGDTKTLSGSVLGVFGGTIAGIFLIRSVLGVPEELEYGNIMIVALTASVAEGLSGKWDNIAVPMSVLALLSVISGYRSYR